MKSTIQALFQEHDFAQEVTIDVSSLRLHSQDVTPGAVFFCLADSSIAEKYITDALSRGAVALVISSNDKSTVSYREAEGKRVPMIEVPKLSSRLSLYAKRFYGNASIDIPVIGVTGTNGKTSVTHFIAQTLLNLDYKPGIIGTVGLGIYPNLSPSNYTTPDIFHIYELMASFNARGATHIVMEVSSHGLDQGRVEGIQFDTAILTNITRDHLDYHKTFDAYCRAKRRLFENESVKQIILNCDDPVGKAWAEQFSKKKTCMTYATKTSAFPSDKHIHVKHIVMGAQEMEAEAYIQEKLVGKLKTSLIGEFNISNILAVFAYLSSLVDDANLILEAMASLHAVPGRLERVGKGDAPLIIVDFAHTPDALEKVLQVLKKNVKEQLFCIVGCGGDRDKGKRPLMAKVAEKYCDKVILTNDNPRHEDPKDIVTDMLQGLVDSGKATIVYDREKAIQKTIQMAGKGDVVLIAGKGHEKYQVIGDTKVPFDDVITAKKYSEER